MKRFSIVVKYTLSYGRNKILWETEKKAKSLMCKRAVWTLSDPRLFW